MIISVTQVRNGKDELVKISIVGDNLREVSGKIMRLLGFYREGAILSTECTRCENGDKWQGTINFM